MEVTKVHGSKIYLLETVALWCLDTPGRVLRYYASKEEAIAWAKKSTPIA